MKPSIEKDELLIVGLAGLDTPVLGEEEDYVFEGGTWVPVAKRPTLKQGVWHEAMTMVHMQQRSALGAVSRRVEREQVLVSDPAVMAQVRELRREVQALKQTVAQLRNPSTEWEDVIPRDEYLDWCEAHQEELHAYPNSFVAIDLKKGVLFAEKDQADFTARLKKLSKEEREAVYTTFTTP
jgi:hypothetical protein